METEEQIVYQLLEAVRGSDINNDETIGEREIRSYLRSYRAQILNKSYFEGALIPNNVFQSLGVLTMPSVVDSNNPLIYNLTPLIISPIINFNENNGLRVWIYDRENSINSEEIEVKDYDSFILNQKHPIFKYSPSVSYKNNSIYLYSGKKFNKNTLNENKKGNANTQLLTDITGQSGSPVGGTHVKIYIEAVLQNPDDSLGYDWTFNPYPFPSELIHILKKEILRNEFNLILQTKSDNIGNMDNELNDIGNGRKR